ncbi:DNA-dependent RNA polymerase domain-containing protein [Hirsutella rhossiliensis]|uniref:DNA-directed RNA polymerase n=1 Tax=Hirsutella rhossiliensis TaxID=111463 RepID=A0A9P8MTQ2_9HYPO|nr:DNA-dependent RNA polymerase domain-containing protein [Hirsutella rhossiliensis]KAH0961065.1 DNA-dependent RNA polymerase domain-containing protein [Hirsutella rhossiliensis]
MILSRHTRSGLLAHRGAAARSTWVSSRHAALSSTVPSTARRHAERSLATAVDDFKLETLPYNNLTSSTLPPFQPPRSYDLRAFDPTSPLTIPEPGPPRPPTKTNVFGVPGETEDMLPVFDACLRVGKLDRAALVLKRLNAVGTLSIEEQTLLNNQYLRASLKQLSSSPDRQRAEGLHQWYELQIRSKGLPHTAETIACMLKASLLSERGSRLHRLVKRYMGMAPNEAGLLVLNMADILSDRDLAVITDICPTYNFSQEPELEGPAIEARKECEPVGRDLVDQPTDLPGADSISELVPTPQKGLSLDTLKHNLEILSSLQDTDISELPESERREIQLLLERDSITSAIAKWRAQMDTLHRKGVTTATGSRGEGSLSQYMASWMSAMQARLQEEQSLIEMSENKASKSEKDLERCLYGPLLRQADPARLAAVTILTTVNLSAMLGIEKGVVVSRLITNIAKVVQEDTELQQKEEAKKAQRTRRVEFTGHATGSDAENKATASTPTEDSTPRESSASSEKTVLIAEPSGAEHTLKESTQQPWSVQIRAHVGAILLKVLLETAKIKVTIRNDNLEIVSQYQPAFTHLQQPRKGKRVGLVFLNPQLSKKFLREPVGDFLAKHLPMVVEPKPWQNFTEGGFLDSKTSLVRVKPGNSEQTLYNQAAVQCGDMDQVLKGLDVLGKTAWQVNNDVLGVMMEAWNTGEEIANFPPLSPEFKVPAEPDSSADPLARNNWIRAVKAVENKRSSLHSQRCFMNLQLEVARAFRNHTIYFPHNVDYRGRAYPMPTYLNHMGADHARAILKFAKGKELGVRGLRWLKIHLANVYGLDKSSFDEREAFTNENVANIVASATNPLKGSRWWLQAEEPWQCLAACFELKAALDLADPTRYVSQLPVHQDGTCNGLQHYAALGGDAWGAKQVNLEPGDRPADVYSAVADLVKQAIDKDAAVDISLGKILQGKITRKVVKQTVMTNVYGVTFAGAKLQVCKQLDALYPNLGKDNGFHNNVGLAIYVAKHIFYALATMFRGAHDIQYWLGSVGGRVCRALTPLQLEQIAKSHAAAPEKEAKGTPKPNKETTKKDPTQKSLTRNTASGFKAMAPQFRSTLVWTTPLRMPVVQPYRKSNAKEIRTCLQAVVYSMEDQTDPVNSRKQLQAFPPNFIHSLDASHMMLSALRCHERNLDFAAVHDSFWTHAGDVDSMNEVLREAFIQIHEEDVIGRLATEFKARHKGHTPVEELLMEYERQSLIMAGKLDEAKKIVTPASVYEDMSACEVDLAIQEDTKAIGIGEIHEDEADATACKVSEDMVDEEDEAALGAQPSSSTAPAETVQRLLEEMKGSHFESSMLETRKPTQAKAKKTPLPLWLPLTIPDIPKKGDFEVKRLRESKYFFS